MKKGSDQRHHMNEASNPDLWCDAQSTSTSRLNHLDSVSPPCHDCNHRPVMWLVTTLWKCDVNHVNRTYDHCNHCRKLTETTNRHERTTTPRPLSICTKMIYIYCVWHKASMYTQYIHSLPQSRLGTANYALITSSFCYHGSLRHWTVVHTTAAKFKPLVFNSDILFLKAIYTGTYPSR
jgi:hypothetical protein